ncbi:MAG: response regulator transcription factor [Rhizobacter sp.]|nr:response regulator transcription factor [Ferruginibacter sp.]
MEKINILIVDDHPMVLEGLKSLLSGISYLQIAGIATNAFEAIDIIKNTAVAVAIVDINLPDINGIELTKKIKAEYPAIKVLAMSTFKERSYISQMIQNGASGYLVKSASKEEIEEAILAAYEGKLYLSMDITAVDVNTPLTAQLPAISTREKEVLGLIADGLTNHQIAAQLFISLHTVESHRKNLLIKFEANNTATLIKLAVKYNIV